MTEYRASIKRRMVILAVCTLCALVFVGTAGVQAYLQSIDSDAHLRDFSTGMSSGLFFAMLAVSVMNLMKYRAVLRDESKLKALYVQEHDERWLLIQSRTGGFAYTLAMGVIMLAGVGICFFRVESGFALLMAAGFMAVLKLILLIYYKRKY